MSTQYLNTLQLVHLAHGWPADIHKPLREIYPLVQKIQNLKDRKIVWACFGFMVALIGILILSQVLPSPPTPQNPKTELTFVGLVVGFVVLVFLPGGAVAGLGYLLADKSAESKIHDAEKDFDRFWNSQKQEILPALAAIQMFEPHLIKALKKDIRQEVENYITRSHQ